MRVPGQRRTFRFPFGRHQVERDIDDELAFHLEMTIERLIAEGRHRAEAEAEARARFGDVGAVRASCVRVGVRGDRLDRWRTLLVEARQDAAYGLRGLRRYPLFAAATILTLALGMGASTAIFSVLHAVVLRPLPYPQPEKVVAIELDDGETRTPVSPGILLDWQDGLTNFSVLSGLRPVSVTLHGEPAPERLDALRVSSTFFDVFAVDPAIGRAFNAEEDVPGAQRVVVMSDRLWRSRFAADRDVLGRPIVIDGEAHTVLGVLPAAFDLSASGTDLWLPLALPPDQRQNLATGYLGAVGRLSGSVGLGTAREELITRLAALGIETRSGEAMRASVVPLDAELLRDHRRGLWLLFAAVVLVLLIGCANVANLLLARGVARRGEFVVRASLGAGRARLLRQLMSENLVLAGVGALGGVALAVLLIDGLKQQIPADIPRLAEAGLDPWVLAFAVGLAGISSLVFGLLPAWQSSRLDLRAGLQTRDGAARGSLRGILITAEVALAVVLLLSSGLLLRSFHLLRDVPTGFEHGEVLTAGLALPRMAYPEIPEVVATYQQILDEVRQTSGIESAALVSRVPLGGGNPGLDFALAGTPIDTVGVQSRIRIASAGYFETLGVPIVRGRGFTAADRAGAPRALILNAALAERLRPGGEVVGESLYSDGGPFRGASGEPILWEIVGVAGNLKDGGLRAESPPAVFLPIEQAPAGPWQWNGRQMILTARTRGHAAGMLQPLREAVAAVDPSLPLDDVQTLEQRFAESLAIERYRTGLLAALSGLGWLLAAIGVFGLVTYTVEQRRYEIGVRLAMGADGTSVIRRMRGYGLRPVLLGLAIGTAAVLLGGHWLSGFLYGIEPFDPLTLGFVAASFLVVAFLASDLPAQRAAKVHPVEVLRAP